ncbi:MAG TPA: ester cyclase [Hyphomicrobiaceae bacterium]|nr:ester cyclase [Hyphomicrobiaceae bacterium]
MSGTPEANKALVLAHYDAVTNSHDPDAIRAQVAPDFFDHATGRAMSADEVIAHSRGLHATFGDLNAVAEAIIAEGDLVAARVVWRGVHIGAWQGIAPTHKRVEFRGMTFWRVRDGRIVERWANIDYAGLAAQLRA